MEVIALHMHVGHEGNIEADNVLQVVLAVGIVHEHRDLLASIRRRIVEEVLGILDVVCPSIIDEVDLVVLGEQAGAEDNEQNQKNDR